jgi:hypothetical protein
MRNLQRKSGCITEGNMEVITVGKEVKASFVPKIEIVLLWQ